MTARRLRTVFFGSSAFAVPSLKRILREHDVVAVVTQPDKPAGRGLELTSTPAAVVAQTAGLDVLMPARLDDAFVERVRQLRPQLLACVSYGKILPAALLELPDTPALNVHPSLLPLYRGATPIQAALRDGRSQTGVTIFWMVRRMDAGDIALARTLPIEASDDYGTLHDKLAEVGAELLLQAALLLGEGRLPRTRQREEDATYCKQLSKDDLRLVLDAPAERVVDQVRSLSPKPGAWMSFAGKRLKVLKAEALPKAAISNVDPSASNVEPSTLVDGTPPMPGTLLRYDRSGPVIATAGGAIRLLLVIPEGRAQMSGAEFAKAAAASR